MYRLHGALCNQIRARSGSNWRPSVSSRSAAVRGATELLFLALESAPRGGEGASYRRQHCSPWHIVDEPECKNRGLLRARFWLLLFEFFLQDLAEYHSMAWPPLQPILATPCTIHDPNTSESACAHGSSP